MSLWMRSRLVGDNDVVDGDMDKFDKETNESHNEESHTDGLDDLGVFC